MSHEEHSRERGNNKSIVPEVCSKRTRPAGEVGVSVVKVVGGEAKWGEGSSLSRLYETQSHERASSRGGT